MAGRAHDKNVGLVHGCKHYRIERSSQSSKLVTDPERNLPISHRMKLWKHVALAERFFRRTPGFAISAASRNSKKISRGSQRQMCPDRCKDRWMYRARTKLRPSDSAICAPSQSPWRWRLARCLCFFWRLLSPRYWVRWFCVQQDSSRHSCTAGARPSLFPQGEERTWA